MPFLARCWILAALLASASVRAADAPPTSTLDADVQTLKQDVLDLNRELYLLEEELLFPANTQVAVFLSVDIGTLFRLDSVSLQLDGKEVANHLYTAREAQALIKGGVQQLFVGNLKTGSHELVAVFTGSGPQGRDLRRATSFKLDKGIGSKFVELKVSDSAQQRQPDFVVKVWE